MTPDRGNRGSAVRRDADHVIDRLLDGGLSREQSQELLRSLRRDSRACEDLARTRICIERLREPVEAPDLTDSILSRVHARRRFLPARGRRLVTVGRCAVAAGVVGAVALASFVQRHAPEVRLADPTPAPVSRFVEATAPAAPEQAGLEQAVHSIQASLAAPVRGLSLSPRYRPEGQFHFDLSLERSRAAAARPFSTAFPSSVATAAVPDVEGAAPAEAEAQFISRFGSLLVILREPPAPIDDLSADE